jgi:hypothetical protein
MYRKLTLVVLGMLATLGLAAAMSVASAEEASSASDPTVNQIYDAARAGHLDQAKQMMNQVLADHPRSARAHYVAAQLDADMKNFGEARQELKTAEDISPGLPFARAEEVSILRRELGLAGGAAGSGVQVIPTQRAPGMYGGQPAKSYPWGIIALVAGVIIVLWLLFRRRQPSVVYGASGQAPMGPMGSMPMGMPPSGFPSVMGGGGSGIVGGLASGLAVGAGLAAGEELVHHVLDGGREVGGGVPLAPEPVAEPPANADLGGPDFGISDPGGGWDDGGSSGDSGGGGDWT